MASNNFYPLFANLQRYQFLGPKDLSLLKKNFDEAGYADSPILQDLLSGMQALNRDNLTRNITEIRSTDYKMLNFLFLQDVLTQDDFGVLLDNVGDYFVAELIYNWSIYALPINKEHFLKLKYIVSDQTTSKSIENLLTIALRLFGRYV